MRIKTIRGPVALTGAALILSACASGGGGTTTRAGADCDPDGEVGPGVTDSQIHVGTTMPLSGSGAAGGIGTKEGQQAYYDKVNEEGGVQGREIKLTVLDDEYDPSTAQRQMRQLIEQQDIFVVSGGEGTPNFLGAAPFIQRAGVPAIAPYAPSDEMGTMENDMVFMATVDYIQEFEILTDYVLQQGETPKKMALVGVAGNVGENAKLGMENGLEGTDVELLYIPETPGTTDFTPIASQLNRFGAEYVFLILTNADTGGLLKAMSRVGYTPQTAAWAGMADDSYIEEFGDVSQGMLVALETAALNSEDPKVQEFITAFKEQTGKEPTKFNELGWVQAQLTAEALTRAETLSRPCVIEALESFEEFETGLVPPVTWGPEDRAGVDAVGIGRIEGDELTVLEETQSLD